MLAADVVAAEQVPPFANSAVDGYAVRAADVAAAPVELAVVAEVAAGAAAGRVLGQGEAIRIATGAPIPDGAGAVVMVEDTERVGDGRVHIGNGVVSGVAVRPAGDDVQPGDLLFTAGTVVTPAVVGVLASVNARTVSAHRGRVAVLSTGDELVEDGGPLRRARSARATAGCSPACCARRAATSSITAPWPTTRRRWSPCSGVRPASAAIVTSGGVSMGEYDVVKAVLGRIADMTWMQIAIKPAKPFAFGTWAASRSSACPATPSARSSASRCSPGRRCAG